MTLGRGLLALFVALAMLIPNAAVEAQTRASDTGTGREILVMLRLAPPHYRPNSGYSGDYGDGAARTARRRIALGIAHRNGFELIDGWPMPVVGVDCYVMRIPANVTIETAIAQVSKDPSVVWSEQMSVFRTDGAVHSRGF